MSMNSESAREIEIIDPERLVPFGSSVPELDDLISLKLRLIASAFMVPAEIMDMPMKKKTIYHDSQGGRMEILHTKEHGRIILGTGISAEEFVELDRKHISWRNIYLYPSLSPYIGWAVILLIIVVIVLLLS